MLRDDSSKRTAGFGQPTHLQRQANVEYALPVCESRLRVEWRLHSSNLTVQGYVLLQTRHSAVSFNVSGDRCFRSESNHMPLTPESSIPAHWHQDLHSNYSEMMLTIRADASPESSWLPPHFWPSQALLRSVHLCVVRVKEHLAGQHVSPLGRAKAVLVSFFLPRLLNSETTNVVPDIQGMLWCEKWKSTPASSIRSF